MKVYTPGNSACCPLLKYVEFIHEMNAMTSLNVESREIRSNHENAK